jgi:hypothetical protein
MNSVVGKQEKFSIVRFGDLIRNLPTERERVEFFNLKMALKMALRPDQVASFLFFRELHWCGGSTMNTMTKQK